MPSARPPGSQLMLVKLETVQERPGMQNCPVRMLHAPWSAPLNTVAGVRQTPGVMPMLPTQMVPPAQSVRVDPWHGAPSVAGATQVPVAGGGPDGSPHRRPLWHASSLAHGVAAPPRG